MLENSHRFPLDSTLLQIEFAAQNNLELIAIFSAVALPDMCAALASENGRTTKQKYKDWCDKNLSHKFTYITSEELYSIRCGIVHQGRATDINQSRVTENSGTINRVLFALGKQAIFSNCKLNDAYVYSAKEFCLDLVGVVRHWLAENSENPIIRTNMEKIIQLHPNGLAPYAIGIPLIG